MRLDVPKESFIMPGRLGFDRFAARCSTFLLTHFESPKSSDLLGTHIRHHWRAPKVQESLVMPGCLGVNWLAAETASMMQEMWKQAVRDT